MPMCFTVVSTNSTEQNFVKVLPTITVHSSEIARDFSGLVYMFLGF